jgi:hypothetical protein
VVATLGGRLAPNLNLQRRRWRVCDEGDDVALLSKRYGPLLNLAVVEYSCMIVGTELGFTGDWPGGRRSDPSHKKTPQRFCRGALKARGRAGTVYAAVAANFPRSVFTNRASFPFSLISLSIAE